ncbi:dUTP diphosphatase [Liquorilactobacillus mali]|uniref:dUTP diphosphatase n=1 Tax=Liquorilactobacillus mali TaxID=1618 RepID=A0A0R2FI58_9LACO|nr:dUTP diphosphatase [Liquorilactobacillus mali]KRN28280.1 Deoxyuridine 5-triphosphate nucleotidohydrolase [Liquorilactobacillus mali]MDN7146438.1 dUTP diphosphatase [Liquorilactobacillus mali]
MKRGFEVVKRFKKEEITLPTRATKNAAGYDFYAAQDFVLPSIWKLNFLKILWSITKKQKITDIDYEKATKVLKPLLVPTGIKAYMGDEEFLMLANRSSNPLKRNLILPNGVGIVDADYYGNADNDGEIFFQLMNFGIRDVVIKKNERIGQGIFIPFLTIDSEEEPLKKRTGGFGSSGR